jgi:hypothetical protein
MIFKVDLGTAQDEYRLLNIMYMMPVVLLIRWRYPAYIHPGNNRYWC